MAGQDEASQAERQARRAHARGLRLLERGWAREAMRALAQAVSLCPERVESWRALAAAAAEAEEPVEALWAALEALRAAPERLDLKLDAGTLLHTFALPLAARLLEEAVADEDLAADAHLTLARIHADLGQARAAQEHAEAALARDPDDLDALQELANLFLDTGEVARSIALLRRGLDLDPDDPSLWLDLARAYVTQGLTGPAGGALERARQASAGDPDLGLVEAGLAAATGRPEEAMGPLQRALRVAAEVHASDPSSPPVDAWLEDPLLAPLHDFPPFLELLERGPTP